MGIVLLLVAALSGYVWQNGGSDDEPELAEETSLGRYATSSPEAIDFEADEDESLLENDSKGSEGDGVDGLMGRASATSLMEIPHGGKSHGIVVEHTGYTLSYDTLNHNPFWVAWELTQKEAKGRTSRGDEFLEDPKIPARHAVRPSTYSGSGYSRGHMCPAGDQKWSREAMDESFYMSNMCPQTIELNKLWWDWLERAEREWAKEEGHVYIVCGPIYDEGRPVKNVNKKKSFFVGIPHRFFKVILSTRKGQEKALGFIYRNDASEQLLEDCVCTVDEVERITGYDFFAPLEDGLEQKVEGKATLMDWKVVPQ